MHCTRCEGTGFLNLGQIEDYEVYDPIQQTSSILEWIRNCPDEHDVQVCDCCGDGSDWYGIQGEHYNCDDPQGQEGPYEYNGGLCECH